MFNRHDISRNECQLFWFQAQKGYDWWWHSFTAHHAESGEEKAFFIEYFLCNPISGDDRPHFGRLGRKPSYIMIKAGTWGEDAAQLHRFFGWKQAEVSMQTPFSVKAKDCFVTEDRMYGEINISPKEAADHPEYMCQHGSMKWNLRIDKKIAFNVGYGAGRLFRELQLFEMFWHAEGMKTAYEGEVIWNGERYIVVPQTCYGYADKNWGKNFTSPWVWLSSCNLTSEITGKKLNDSAFDIGGGRPKVGPIALDRKLLSAFWYEGQPYEFNFSKFWTGCRTDFDCKETETEIIWHVDQRTRRHRMITDITCKKKDMLLVNYEAPDGSKRHNRLWNGGNGKGTIQLFSGGKLVDRIHAENVGCEYGEYTPEEEMFKAGVEEHITGCDGEVFMLSYNGERFQMRKLKEGLMFTYEMPPKIQGVETKAEAAAEILEKLREKEVLTTEGAELRLLVRNPNKAAVALKCLYDICFRLKLMAEHDIELYEDDDEAWESLRQLESAN